MSWIRKNAYLFWGILLITVTVSIFGPIELYFTNYEEFWFSWRSALNISVILTVLCILFLGAIGLFLRGKARDLYSCILFLLGIALYIQGNYANINYGILNGEAVDWSAYPVYAFFDTSGWLLIIAGGLFLWFYKRDLLHKIQKYVTMFIIAIQVITLGVLFFTVKEATEEKSACYLSTDGIYEVSSDENIIIFVLDAFDDIYFQEIIKEEPEKYEKIFENFTHYNNASAGGASTKIGMSAIVTGKHYPGGISYTDYIRQSFDHDGLYSALQKEKYDVRLYTESVFVPDGVYDLVNNQESEGYKVADYSGLTQKYLSLTLYKYMPHILKRFFWIYTGDFDQYRLGGGAESYVTDDAAYFAGLKDKGLQVRDQEKVFRIIHLNGAHPPFCIDENALPVSSEETSIISQSKGALHIVEEYISQLKEMGYYDSSTIIVMADHGQENPAHGILLVKRRGIEMPFTEVDSPVSYYDLHEALFQELGKNADAVLFQDAADFDPMRERYFYLQNITTGNIEVKEHVVSGNINDAGSVRETGVVLSSASEEDRVYKYGTQLLFGGESTAIPYVVSGISPMDMDIFSWTDGYQAQLEFELEKNSGKDLLVTLDVMAVYKHNEDAFQRVIIYANDIKCFEEKLTEGKEIQFKVSQDIVSDTQKLSLRIEVPDAVSPSELFGAGNDKRTLGIAIRGLRIDEADTATGRTENIESNQLKTSELEANESYEFGVDGSALPYLLDGWHEEEAGHNWGEERAELIIKTLKACDYVAVINYSQYTPSGDTKVYINDVQLAVLDENESSITVNIPKDLLNEDGNQIMVFETPDAVSPEMAGDGEDKRVLGICLYHIKMSPIE